MRTRQDITQLTQLQRNNHDISSQNEDDYTLQFALEVDWMISVISLHGGLSAFLVGNMWGCLLFQVQSH